MGLKSTLGALLFLCLIYVAICATGISRTKVSSRAQTWVEAKVPYSQTKEKDGYRTDSSGYVSMAWELGQNYNTNTLVGITSYITKDSLMEGDILLKAGGHATIFSSWVDKAKTSYWGYEVSSTQGAVYRQIPYPYFNNKEQFLPRRYKNIQ